MKKLVLCAIGLITLVAANISSGADLPPYRLKHMTAYPVSAATAKPIALDGDLGEWRPDAFVTIVQDPAVPELRACRVAIAYDNQGVYVVMDVNDTSPMQNEVDPIGDPFSGWRGDSMQMRFTAPGGSVSHWTWWYFTERNLPAVDVRYGMGFTDPVTLTGANANLKYLKRKDGYSFELLMPWKLLRAAGPGAGWRTILEPHFNVFGKEVIAYADCITREENAMYKRSELWGELRFADASNAGAAMAEQKRIETVRAKLGTEQTPSWGVPIAINSPEAGFMSLAIADQSGRNVRTLLARARRPAGEITEYWDGLDDDGNPVQPGNYTARVLVHPGIKPRFVCSVMNSGTPPWITADGKGSWGADHGKPQDAAAGPNGQVYLLWEGSEAGFTVIGVDTNGHKQWGTKLPFGSHFTAFEHADGKLYIAEPDKIAIYNAQTGANDTAPDGRAQLQVGDWQNAGSGISGIAAAPTAMYVALSKPGKVIALDRKSLKPVKSWDLPNVGHIAYDAGRNRIYAVSGGKVWAIDPAGNMPPKPFIESGLDSPTGICTDRRGNVYVAQQGKRMCVTAFGANGKAIVTIGKEGGRPVIGKYDPSGMLNPEGICVDTMDRLWVTESDVSPKRISQWDIRSGRFLKEFFGGASYAVMMAPDPENPEQVYLHNCRFIVDYEKGISRPDATLWRGSGAHYGFMGGTLGISRYKGKTFAYNGASSILKYGDSQFEPLVEVAPSLPNNIFQFGGTFFPGASLIKGRQIFRPQNLAPDGVPSYPKPTEAPQVITGNGPMTKYSNWMDVWPSLESDWSEFYSIASLPDTKHGGIPDGGGGDGIFRFRPDGEIIWRYPRVKVFYAIKDQRLAGSGDLMGALRIAGLVQMPQEKGGEIICIGCYRGYFGLLSGNGLFIDKISDDKGKGLPPDFDTFYIENFSGYFFKHPRTGKVYLFCGDVDGRILELQGFENIRSFSGSSIALGDADVKRLATARVQAAKGELQEAPSEFKVARVNDAPAPDGASLPAGTMLTLGLDETRKAEMGLCRDDRNLYAIFRVDDPSPWKNGSTDWKLLFKGGDAVDLQLNDGGKTVRVFTAPGAREGEFNVVAMWPQTPAGMNAAPEVYKSPVGQETFQRVAKLDNATVKLSKREAGYTVVVTLPWSALGLTPPGAGSSMRGDMGILFSDPSGMRTIRRCYMFNKETSIVDDVPSEVRLNQKAWSAVKFQ